MKSLNVHSVIFPAQRKAILTLVHRKALLLTQTFVFFIKSIVIHVIQNGLSVSINTTVSKNFKQNFSLKKLNSTLLNISKNILLRTMIVLLPPHKIFKKPDKNVLQSIFNVVRISREKLLFGRRIDIPEVEPEHEPAPPSSSDVDTTMSRNATNKIWSKLF